MRTPRLNEDELREIIAVNGVDSTVVSLVAIRGYYLDSMGQPGQNDRRLYDDAIFIVHPDGVERYQANTDPNGWRNKTSRRKGMAMLKTGIHIFGKGLHKGAQAFRQCEPFTVHRDGDSKLDCGFHAINLHTGGYNSTSSLGCQTIPKSTWRRFKTSLYSLLDEYDNPMRLNDWGQRVRSFDYILLDETERRKGNLITSQRYIK